jgi:hypothetical protein
MFDKSSVIVHVAVFETTWHVSSVLNPSGREVTDDGKGDKHKRSDELAFGFLQKGSNQKKSYNGHYNQG